MTARIALALMGPMLLAAQTYTPGDFQSANANYKTRNPFYFEGRVDWDLLNITQPSNAWEFVQRGIHDQDDLEDIPSAIADYGQALAMNSLVNGSCQLISAAPAGLGQNTNPAPCMFTVRLRLASLIRKDQPQNAIGLLQEVLLIDPLRLGVNAMIGQTYSDMAQKANDYGLYRQAIAAFQAELALSPVNRRLSGDEANNAHVHWALAEIYRTMNDPPHEAAELRLYLSATRWHSDTYPWRIQLAQGRLVKLRAQ
jgi:tetratricopeptide (TPR) repeat protein